MPTNDFQRASQLINLLRVALLVCLIGLAGCGNKGALYLPSAPEAQSGSEAQPTAPAQTTEPDTSLSPTSDPQ